MRTASQPPTRRCDGFVGENVTDDMLSNGGEASSISTYYSQSCVEGWRERTFLVSHSRVQVAETAANRIRPTPAPRRAGRVSSSLCAHLVSRPAIRRVYLLVLSSTRCPDFGARPRCASNSPSPVPVLIAFPP